MIGELGALGGGLVPSVMGSSRQYLGSYAWGFAFFAACAVIALLVLRALQPGWTRQWVGAGGRARGVALPAGNEPRSVRMPDGLADLA